MYNYFTLIGAIEEMRTSTYSFILAVPRPFISIDGSRNKDYIKVCYSDSLKEIVEDYLHECLKIGVKGRIESDGQNINLVAEKIMFFD